MGYEEGSRSAMFLTQALYHLGYPWELVGPAGLKFLDRFEAESPDDMESLEAMRVVFHEIQDVPPDQLPLDSDSAPSEYVVIDELMNGVEDATGEQMPWVGDAIYDILNDYDAYVDSLRDGMRRREWDKLKDRVQRIRHAILDIQDQAAGRG